MKLEVNVSKKYAFVIVGALLIVAGVIGVFADWGDTVKTVFHDAGDVKVAIDTDGDLVNEDYNLQEAIDGGLIGGGGGTPVSAEPNIQPFEIIGGSTNNARTSTFDVCTSNGHQGNPNMPNCKVTLSGSTWTMQLSGSSGDRCYFVCMDWN